MNLNITAPLVQASHSDLFGLSFLVRQGRNWLELQRIRQAVRKERDQLAELPDHLLHDIGVSRGDALAESQRSYEDIPTGRMNCW